MFSDYSNVSIPKGHASPAKLDDVAAACGVSASTVSKILNGAKNFKPETIKKVMHTAAKLHYTPNAMARSIVKNFKNPIIGFFVPNIMNPFFAELVNAVEKILSQSGYSLTLCLFNDDDKKISYFLNFLTEIRAAGAIFGSFKGNLNPHIFVAAMQQLSVVSIQADIENVDRIDVTDEAGTYEIINYLIKKGHRKIGFVGYKYDMLVTKNRLDGYKRALIENNITIRPEYICNGKHSAQSGYEMTKYLLDLPDPPTAIHCFNEFMAQSAYEAIGDAGLKIPQDISVTGFDNVTFSRAASPKLTTVAEPIETMAQLAVGRLLSRIENPNEPQETQHILVQHRFIERNSVADINRKTAETAACKGSLQP